MIKVSKLADYSVVVLAALAGQSGRAMSAAELSGKTCLPLPTVAKVLKALAKAGIVTGARGVAGGYSFATAPKDISIAQVVTAVDGPIRVTDCADTSRVCPTNAQCGMHGRWGLVNRALIDALGSVTLADMMNRAPHARTAA